MRYRIAWKVADGTSGHGEWTPDRASLEAWIEALTSQYPHPSRHWIESISDAAFMQLQAAYNVAFNLPFGEESEG